MLENFFKTKEHYLAFMESLEESNGKLESGKLTESIVLNSIKKCENDFQLKKTDYDKGLQIECFCIMPKVASSYQHMRVHASCMLRFSKGKISKYSFGRMNCSTHGNMNQYTLFLTEEMLLKISKRIFQKVEILK